MPPTVADALRADLGRVADHAVAEIIAEVPSYVRAWSGPMANSIRTAVHLALSGFIDLASGQLNADAATPLAPVIEDAYRLGSGEARGGRSMEALLAAYRIGARTAWREMAEVAVAAGLTAAEVSGFAELVFAYIDEISAASAAGHADELERTGRVRQRTVERLVRSLVTGVSGDALTKAIAGANWKPSATLTAVVVPISHLSAVLIGSDSRSLSTSEDVPGLDDDRGLVLVAGNSRSTRSGLMRRLDSHRAVAGPTVEWREVASSYDRVRRWIDLNPALPRQCVDVDARLAELVIGSDPLAHAELKARVLAPLNDLRPAVADKLAQTLVAWLLHQGRRDDIAEALFVHPQTVRYRVGQLRELYGAKLTSPEFVRDAIIALS